MSAGILQFSLPIYRITESGEWLTERVQVIRTGGSTGAISVKVTGKSETATIGKDIEKISQTLTWADGDTIPKFVDIKLGVEPDGLLNLRPDGSDWCFDVGQNNIITIPNSVSGANSIDIIKITRLNNTITLDVNGVLASKPVTQTYNTSNGLVIGNFQSFDGKIYGLKIFVPSPSLSS